MSDKISRATLSMTSPSTLATRAILQFLIPGWAGLGWDQEQRGNRSIEQPAARWRVRRVCSRARVSVCGGGWGEGTGSGSHRGRRRYGGGPGPQREMGPSRLG